MTFDLLQVPPVTDRPGPLPPADLPSTSSPLAEGPHPCFSRESIRQESLSALCQQPVSTHAQNSRYWLLLCRWKLTPLCIRGDTPPLLVLLRCHTELLKLHTANWTGHLCCKPRPLCGPVYRRDPTPPVPELTAVSLCSHAPIWSVTDLCHRLLSGSRVPAAAQAGWLSITSSLLMPLQRLLPPPPCCPLPWPHSSSECFLSFQAPWHCSFCPGWLSLPT